MDKSKAKQTNKQIKLNVTSKCETRIAACSSNTCIKVFKILKWNVGVINFLRVFHFEPSLKQEILHVEKKKKDKKERQPEKKEKYKQEPLNSFLLQY